MNLNLELSKYLEIKRLNFHYETVDVLQESINTSFKINKLFQFVAKRYGKVSTNLGSNQKEWSYHCSKDYSKITIWLKTKKLRKYLNNLNRNAKNVERNNQNGIYKKTSVSFANVNIKMKNKSNKTLMST